MIKEQKKQIRRKALACRNALTEPERERGKLLITERILGHQWYYLSDTILGFVSYGSEICTTEILESALQDGKNVYVPKVEDGKMEFYRMFSLSELKNGYKKIPEPAGDTARYVFEPEHAHKSLLLMPGSAFDPLGNRMGYGGGFYDRYLSSFSGCEIGVIYSDYILPVVPRGRFDVSVDTLLTEKDVKSVTVRK